METVGDLSPNFSRREFACKDRCGRDYPTPALVAMLQLARSRVGSPLRIVSGVRCADHNADVGGSPRSQHITGHAADVPGFYASVGLWKACGAIGIGCRGGLVVHVDVRHGRQPFTFED